MMKIERITKSVPHYIIINNLVLLRDRMCAKIKPLVTHMAHTLSYTMLRGGVALAFFPAL